jgi:DNA-binding transcriptional MocR family regulator
VSQHNPEVIVGVSLASNTQVSSLAATFTRSILGSPGTQELITLNRRRLSAAYSTITAWLRVNGFSFIPVSAGVFVFAKLGHEIATWDEESQLVARCKDAGVVVSAGRNYHGIDSEKGWVRLTFAVEAQALREGLTRLSKALGALPPAENT